MANSTPVVLASDQSALPSSQYGTWNVGRTWALSSITDSVTVTGTVGISGSVAISNFPATQAVTQGGAWTVNTITGFALETGGNLATLATNVPTQGQKTSAASMPVVLASDQGSLTVGLTGNNPVLTPFKMSDENQLYDDNGHLYVNPNVPDADISTGQLQQQQIAQLAQLLASGIIASGLVTVQGAVTVGNTVPVTDAGSSLTVDTGQVGGSLKVTEDADTFDDDGIRYVNPNVAGADISTGSLQQQIIQILGTILTATTANSVVSVPSPITVSNVSATALAPNASIETGGNLQRVVDNQEAILAELRVISHLVAAQGSPMSDSPDQLRSDYSLNS